jgi:predicted patatin/cPLA2 family phospholipase
VTAPVVELLRARAARRSRPPHGDHARIALCVEGGAMRGVVSAGMVSALEELGLVHAFDAVYGSSAGAVNAAYFLAGQAAFGTSIYAEDINNRRFIDLRRLLTGGPVVDLGFLIDDVATHRKPLNTARVLSSGSPLTVMATDVASASRAALRGFRDGGSLLLALRAGATMPALAGPAVTYEGRQYLDASLTEPIPVALAEEDGHTHMLALLTRPDDTLRATTMLDRVYVLPALRRLSAPLAELYAGRAVPYRRILEAIAAGRGPAGRAAVLGLRPPPPVVSKLERSRERLRAGARAGYDAVMRAFGQ